MKNYDGIEMTIRETNKQKYQVLPAQYTDDDMTRAPVFLTHEEAEAFIAQPIPKWLEEERAQDIERNQYNDTYAKILSASEMREKRAEIQELYSEAAYKSKLAAAHQRAAMMGIGMVSCTGRDIYAVRQSGADYQASEADMAWDEWRAASNKYEIAVQTKMKEAGIPIDLFRSPRVVG